MELLLNLFWALLTLASLLWWGRQRIFHRGGAPRRRRTLEIIALGSALALLFPVISLTDDLHTAQAVMDDSSAARKSVKCSLLQHAGADHSRFAHPPALAAAMGPPAVLRARISLVVGESSTPSAPHRDSASTRGPPRA